MIRFRWAGILGAIVNLAAGVFGCVILESALQNPDPPSLLAIALIIPTIYLTFGIGGFAMVHVLWCWNGRPETRLLLRLVEELQKGDT